MQKAVGLWQDWAIGLWPSWADSLGLAWGVCLEPWHGLTGCGPAVLVGWDASGVLIHGVLSCGWFDSRHVFFPIGQVYMKR